MTLLTAKKQLAARVETTAGTDPVGFPVAADAETLPAELSVSPEVDAFVRDFVRESATALKANIGKKTGGVDFKADLKGTVLGTHAAGAPNWSKFMQGVGMEEVELESTLIGAITSGPFRHGELITQAVTAATYTLFMDAHNGATELYLDKDSGTGAPNGTDIWTGQDSGATATPTTVPADEGFGWRPRTDHRKRFDLTGAWGTAPTAGDVISGATSGARGIYEADETTTRIRYRDLRGTFTDGEALDNETSGATSIGTLDTPTLESYVYGHPMSQRVFEDGIAVSMNGCRGSLIMEFEVNRPTRLAFGFRGVFSAAADIPNFPSINYDYGTPPLWAGAVSGYADNENVGDVDESDEQDPCIRTLTLDFGVQLADRECASHVGGMIEVIGGNTREGTFSMDPEATPEADIGWLTALRNGQVQRLRLAVGSADGNRFSIFLPGLQLEAAPSGDRDGTMTREVTGKLTGGFLNNLVASPTRLSSIGGDNELVIIYHTS